MTNDSPYHSLTSYGGHTKRFVIIAVIVIGAVALLYYFTLPGHGDSVGMSPELGNAVRAHFKEKENRSVAQMRSYKCSEFRDGENVISSPEVTVHVVLDNRPARREDDRRSGRWVVLANYAGDRQWQLNSINLPVDGQESDPCRR
ncbi:MAG: hypothetical protein DWQ47_02800 [Acidobacteria bacterium]|nr:MAG: hypothetical protein DWQ32_06350 [Acidobacteriota bacterium]REK01336.1 MAG: hypothetical protein DWQ38_02785 [Acidobacteriota bacterium]REK14292.1 MAG: hypothetical protein DWQ43_12040 [Acidobacteriota bacterium]REK45007.1 MAG: hypothetical protein DWQ47_02800 [Acidobacteriota bacterium]